MRTWPCRGATLAAREAADLCEFFRQHVEEALEADARSREHCARVQHLVPVEGSDGPGSGPRSPGGGDSARKVLRMANNAAAAAFRAGHATTASDAASEARKAR